MIGDLSAQRIIGCSNEWNVEKETSLIGINSKQSKKEAGMQQD